MKMKKKKDHRFGGPLKLPSKANRRSIEEVSKKYSLLVFFHENDQKPVTRTTTTTKNKTNK